MRILIVGSGAREHALAWKCAQSPLAERIYVAPGNGGTPEVARNVSVSADEALKLVRLARKEKIGLAVIGPESAVAAGVGDELRDAGIPVFGPNRAPGRVETSKAFAKDLMQAAGIPTARFEVFTEPEPAMSTCVGPLTRAADTSPEPAISSLSPPAIAPHCASPEPPISASTLPTGPTVTLPDPPISRCKGPFTCAISR